MTPAERRHEMLERFDRAEASFTALDLLVSEVEEWVVRLRAAVTTLHATTRPARDDG